MSVVDSILKRWEKDITLLKKAAASERSKVAANNAQITTLSLANAVSEAEAIRAEQVINNLNTLLGKDGVGG